MSQMHAAATIISSDNVQQKGLREAFWEDGIVKVPQLLNTELLARCLDCFNWSIDNPGPLGHHTFKDTQHQHWVDNLNPLAIKMYRSLVREPVFAELLSDVLGSKHIWYFAEEIFMRKGGKSGRTPWHQDTSYQPWGGKQWANLWISFESLPKKNALEVVRGSHHGPQYDGSNFQDPQKPAAPLHGGSWLPLPDIERERSVKPDAWPTQSFATEPGDVIMLHPHCLHGGASVDTEVPDRRTLVLRFFGDDAFFSPLEGVSQYKFLGPHIYDMAYGGLDRGDPLRSDIYEQIC